MDIATSNRIRDLIVIVKSAVWSEKLGSPYSVTYVHLHLRSITFNAVKTRKTIKNDKLERKLEFFGIRKNMKIKEFFLFFFRTWNLTWVKSPHCSCFPKFSWSSPTCHWFDYWLGSFFMATPTFSRKGARRESWNFHRQPQVRPRGKRHQPLLNLWCPLQW